MSQSALTVPGELSLATMPVRIDRTTSVWSAEIHDGQHWRKVHGRDPLGAARRQAADLLATRPSAVVMIGAGLGYLPEALLSLDGNVRVVVVEPVSAFVEAALARREWTGAIDAGRVVVRTWENRHEPGPLWQLFDRDETEPTLVVEPALANLFPKLVSAMRESLSRSIFEGRANAEARRRQAGRYLLNTLGNLDAIAGSADAGALEGALTGVPAVLVAAGPSLDHNLPALLEMADRVAVIAVDTALRPLLNAGLQPPLAVALDPTELNARHLMNLPPHDDTWLVTEPSVAPNAVGGFASRLLTFRVADHHPWPWLATQALDRHLVRVWGSVLTAALDLAIHTGANPIVFVGADLAYTNGQPYCRNATWERSWAELTGRGAHIEDIWRSDLASRQLLRVSDINGRETETTGHLIAFRDWLIQRMAEATGRTFINATGAGILQGDSIAQGSLDGVAGASGARAALVDRVRRLTGDSARQRVAVGAQLRAALAALPDETHQRWAEFGRGTMTPTDLDAAIAATSQSLGVDFEAVRDFEPTGMLPAADRAARLRAALCGVSCSVADLTSSIDDLVAICEDVAREGGRLSATLGEDSARVPVSLLCAGPAPLMRRIERFEDVLARGLAPTPMAELKFGPTSTGIQATGLGRENAFQVLLAHEWLATRAATASEPALDAPATLHWVLGQAIASSAPDATTALDLTVGGGLSYPLAVDQESLLRRITGLVGICSVASPSQRQIALRRRAGSLEDPSLAVLEAPLLRLDPRRLTDSIGPAGNSTTLDAEYARVTPVNGSASVRVNEAGDVETLAAWPRAIWGEFAVAGTPASYAWHNPDRALLYRARPDANAVVLDAPFRPLRGVALPDGSSLWCAFDGGLWQWRPGAAPEHLVETPTPIHLHLDGDAVRIDAATRRDDGTPIRRRVTSAWTWCPAASALEGVTLDADAQCTSRETSDAWSASAHPYSEVVTISGPGGISARLACYYPLTLAWAGRSLVVCTGEAEVLLFPMLKTRLLEVTR